ncbi:lipase member H [Cyclopterus lumpus]|uniref:Lipase, member Ia n=1 Tax=Cyclopterus lumpus TaxID=8103 RepID=A0A8C2ZWC3_CYCLU|nr:lipase member H [Cyclopterus lumpus]XP_034406833.1 lipase member H [Cyclopterus lumpus]
MFLWQYLTLILPVTVQICKAQICDEFTDLDLSHAIIGTSLKIRLLLYTRDNGTCGTLVSQSDLSAHPQFNWSRPTTFVIHGYRPTGSPPVWLLKITELLLARADVNVIVVDWNRGATNINYFKVVENMHKAADNLAAIIKRMQEHGASLSSIHMIGVSLGAHISGFVGAKLNGSLGRITALDPAGPQFTGTNPEERLDHTDAQFVDVLHTDMDGLGFREPLGHIDFYANGGADQPGCPKTIFSGGSYFKCDHQRSVLLFLDSVKGACTSKAYPCASYKAFLDGDCLSCDRFGAAGCPVFGYDVTEWRDVLVRTGPTKTFFTTNTDSPFCRTNYRMEVMIWNEDIRFGFITVKLHGNGKEAVATINHKASEFKKYTETTLLAQFDKDIQSVKKVSLKFSTGNVLKAKYKLRVLRIRLRHLERLERPLCRYDILLQQDKEVTFKPIHCEESNF